MSCPIGVVLCVLFCWRYHSCHVLSYRLSNVFSCFVLQALSCVMCYQICIISCHVLSNGHCHRYYFLFFVRHILIMLSDRNYVVVRCLVGFILFSYVILYALPCCRSLSYRRYHVGMCCSIGVATCCRFLS